MIILGGCKLKLGRNKLRNYKILALMCSSMMVPLAWADFEVRDENAVDYYGNAQSSRFRKAVTGGDPLTPRQQLEIEEAIPMRETKHYYARVRVNQGHLSLNTLKNAGGGTLAQKSQSKSQAGLEFAIGYVFSPSMRMDVEYLVNKNFQYSASPFFLGTGLTTSLTSQIKNNTVLANVYYDITGFSRFLPYLTAGVGVSANSVNSTLSPAAIANTTNKSLNLAWQVGLGLRIGFLNRWYVDGGYRYITLAQGLRIQPGNGIKLTGNYTQSILSIGLNYLF